MKTKKPHTNLPEDAPASFDHLKDKDPFVVPEGYFETLPSEIMNRIRSEEKILPSARSNRSMWVSVASVAAALAAFVLLFYFLIPGKDEPADQKNISFTEYNAAILDYLQNEAEVDDETMIALLDESAETLVFDFDLFPVQIQDDSIPGHKNGAAPIVLDTTISSDDILKYLLDDGFEIDPNS